MTLSAQRCCIEQLSPDRFVLYWPAISAELDSIPHVWGDHWTKEMIHAMTMCGRFQCWACGTNDQVKVVLFTQIGEYPAGKILQSVLAFGTGIDEMIPDIEASLEAFAGHFGCQLMEVTGRPGWEPKLRKRGWRRSATTLSKRVQRSVN